MRKIIKEFHELPYLSEELNNYERYIHIGHYTKLNMYHMDVFLCSLFLISTDNNGFQHTYIQQHQQPSKIPPVDSGEGRVHTDITLIPE